MLSHEAMSTSPERRPHRKESGRRAHPTALFGVAIVGEALATRQLMFVKEALELATEGGYDGLHMRLIAERASAATGTLYQTFPSKDQLLVAALHRWLEIFEDSTEGELEAIGDPYERLTHITRRMQVKLFDAPALAYALARAYLAAGATAASEVERVRDQMGMMFAKALGLGRPTVLDGEVGHLLTDVWAANVVAVNRIGGTVEDLIGRLDLTIAVLARGHARLAQTSLLA
jgi:TetR/AcrR family transcriptional regulator, cholesterol catabolism regulator